MEIPLDFHIECDVGYYAHVHHTMLINMLHGQCEPTKRDKADAHNDSDGDEGEAHDREHFGGDAYSPSHCGATRAEASTTFVINPFGLTLVTRMSGCVMTSSVCRTTTPAKS
jgi:hypothetical protein